MKNCLRIISSLCVLAVITSMVCGCIVDPNPTNVKIVYENGTPVGIRIEAYGPSNQTLFETKIPVGESRTVLIEAKDIFDLFNPGRISSITVIFDDGKEFHSNSFDADRSLLNVKTYMEKSGTYYLIIDGEYHMPSE